ncbi:MAG: Serine/threonine protein kinase PrkC, regulator of stationary phase [Labilithrix sp.]|nr:Serine/threonine protein kinase PrkC, regulator of stationary phase [Labilithrix sp.]
MTQAPAPPSTDTSRGDPALIGRLVAGKYQIDKFLGGGAMGAVYRARQASLDKNVAVKVMHGTMAADPQFVGRFHREARAASRLDHPNSMRVLDFGEEPDGLLYIVMEYVVGRDLYGVIHEDWPISNEDIGDVLMQALAALAVAHEMGVIHRDLKPENLMILRGKNDEERDAYLVKVCDFGIAKITDRDEDAPSDGSRAGQKLTTQGLVVGTPEYMSPEQARGEKLDARSDLYSMGIILYQLLTGRTPFTGDTALSVILKHITEPAPPPSTHYPAVHEGLAAVAMKALEKDRNDRWQTARAMRNAVREALGGPAVPVGDVHPALAPGAAGAPSGVVSLSGVTRASAGLPSAIESAPTVAGGMASTSQVVLQSARDQLKEPPRGSRTGLLVGLAVVATLIGAAVVIVPQVRARVGASGAATDVSPSAVPSALSSPGPSASSAGSSSSVATQPPQLPATGPRVPEPASASRDPKAPKAATKDPKDPKKTVAGVADSGAESASAAAPASASASAAVAPDAPLVPGGPAAFSAATCKTSSGGSPSSAGPASASDLKVSPSAYAAWSRCAQELKDRPAAPINVAIHLQFTERGFQAADCAACPPPVAACVKRVTSGKIVSFQGKGEVGAESAFEVPLVLSCD